MEEHATFLGVKLTEIPEKRQFDESLASPMKKFATPIEKNIHNNTSNLHENKRRNTSTPKGKSSSNIPTTMDQNIRENEVVSRNLEKEILALKNRKDC